MLPWSLINLSRLDIRPFSEALFVVIIVEAFINGDNKIPRSALDETEFLTVGQFTTYDSVAAAGEVIVKVGLILRLAPSNRPGSFA